MSTTLRGYARSIFLPEDAGETALPRFDLLVMAIAATGGALLVAADVFQRAIYYRKIDTLDIDGQFNIETWFHAMILAGAAFAALGIAFTHFSNRSRLQWLGAATGIAFFSLDKAISLHERFGARIASRFDLPQEAARVAWQVAWSPIIITTAVLLIICIAKSPTRTRLWVAAGLALGASKLFMEAMVFVMVQLGWATADRGVVYGIEANFEETAQLMGFAAFLAAFSQLFVDRLSAVVRGERTGVVPVAVTPEVRETARPSGAA